MLGRCTALYHEDDIGPTKTLRAFSTYEDNPVMNGGNECISTDSEFLPFIVLCKVWDPAYCFAHIPDTSIPGAA